MRKRHWLVPGVLLALVPALSGAQAVPRVNV